MSQVNFNSITYCTFNTLYTYIILHAIYYTHKGDSLIGLKIVVVPIPKKGDLTICDNWRGICLLEVVGKVVARVIQERLQKLAED